MSKKHIVVIGAGVVGLQTAVSLLEAGFDITVLAKHLPGDTATEYTSPWAGAIWCSDALPVETEQQEWDRASYDTWLGALQTKPAEAEEAGLLEVPMRLSWVGHHKQIPYGPSSIWYARHVRNFAVTDPSALTPPFTSGATHDGLAINASTYLKHLSHKVITLGGYIQRANLQPPEDQPGLAGILSAALDFLDDNVNVDAFVNATGLAAKSIVPDDSVYAIRGQTVIVQGEAANITTMFFPDANASIAPRRGSGKSVLGSSHQVNNWDPRPDPEITAKILTRCKEWAPELLNADGEFEVVGVNVGFRPGRKGGPRVEMESVDVEREGQNKRVTVCHSYGHAGSGFQNSFGSARKVVGLISKELSHT